MSRIVRMASQEDVPNDAFEPEQNKRMRPTTPEDPNTFFKITYLIDDCLEHIFKKLDIDDLLSVADSSKRFKQAVDLVYKNKFGKMRVRISKIQRTYGVVQASFGFVWLHDLKSTLRLLRCFGHLIAELNIFYDEKGWPMIDKYISEFCANNLKVILLRKASKDAMENISKSFLRIKVVKLVNGVFGRNLTDFNKLFPEMHQLEIWHPDQIINQNCIEKHFPNLERMTITGRFEDNRNTSFTRSIIAEFIRLNPQLRILHVRANIMDAIFIQRISEHLQRLESLKIRCEHFFNLDDGIIHLKGLKEFTLISSNAMIGPLTNIPLSFDQLSTFKIGARQFQVNRSFLDFINQHRSTLTKVSLMNHSWLVDPLRNTNKMELATAMELLTYIDLGDGILSVDDVIDFLRICKTLKKLQFKLDPRSKEENLLEHISNEWHLYTVGDYITLEVVQLNE